MSVYQQAQSPVDSNRQNASSYESQRPAWDSRQPGYSQPPQHFQPQPRPEIKPDPPPNYWDEEGSDSDVSRTFDIREPVNRIISPVAAPRQLPQVSSPRILNSLDEVQARLDELERIEDHNAQKLKRLEAKRKRKDERIVRRRAMEDEKIRSVLDARARKDERIRNRRQREDDAFRGADRQLGVEELDLRRRLRSLKRGLPADEARQDGNTSVASMSPPMPPHQNQNQNQNQNHSGPPPPKRHQSIPPGQNESQSHYHFYQPPPANPYAVPYHHGPRGTPGPYNGPPPNLHSTPGPAGSPRPSNITVDAIPRTNGFNTPSPLLPPPSGPIDTRPPPPTYAVPTYDTRPPPPPPTTGFTSVNAGQTQPSGFATVNTRGPAYATSPPPKPAKERATPKSEGGGPRRSGKSPKNTTPITVGGLPLNKRTPSTTHPYQMSEAFANRHHHCERTDELNRGIWTSYGYMGSRDVPTGPPVEMYLRCNHDECKRIDWRTVHGLQCHIVKNHEQPKGTIGSLEKALAIYGIPVSEITEYEKVHGLGSAGQMADPKNQKIKNRTKEAMQKSESPASGDMSTPTLTPSASYTSNMTPLGGPQFPPTPSRDNSGDYNLAPLKNMAESSHRQSTTSEAPPKAGNNFVAVRNTWSTYVPPPPPAKKENPSPRLGIDPSPATPVQVIVPSAVQEGTQSTPSASSDQQIAPVTANETPKDLVAAEPVVQPIAQVTQATTAPVDSIDSTPAAVEVKHPVPTTSAEPQAEISKKDLKPDEGLATPTAAPPQIEKEAVSQEPAAVTKSSEPQTTTQISEAPQMPATPGRRPSRRESVTLAKASQKELDAPSMQSPKISKADHKRGGRRASVAVSTTSISATASVDGDGEKSGDEADKDKAAEKESARMSASLKRNATGRFLRKGR